MGAGGKGVDTYPWGRTALSTEAFAAFRHERQSDSTLSQLVKNAHKLHDGRGLIEQEDETLRRNAG